MWTMNYLLPCLLALNLRHVTIVCAWANNNYWAYRHGHPMTPLSLISRTTATKSTYSSSTTRLASTTEASSSSSAAANSADFTLPHLELSHIQHLAQHGYVVIPDFISEDFQAALREDLYHLRSQQYFKQNLVGKDDVDSSILRELQEYLRVKGYIHLVRVVESCRLDLALPETKTTARQLLLQLLQQLPQDLVMHANVLSHHTAKTRHIPTRQLDTSTPFSSTTWHEYLYAYYPQGAFMSRHVDEEPGSAFDFRCYSLLLYLNDNEIWKSKDDHGGQLRLHFDSGRDECPQGESPNYITVKPYGGTLVLFSSCDIPHEVVNTHLERLVVVGFFSRKDVLGLAAGMIGVSPVQLKLCLGILAVSATLIMAGIYQFIM